MKKALVTFVLLLSFLLHADAQYGSRSSHYSNGSGPKIGLCVTGAGVAFSVAGFLTTPDYTWVSTPSPGNQSSGYWKKKPFMQQGSRSMCIVTGVTLTFTGLITMLTGN